MEKVIIESKEISIEHLKHTFAKKYPNSTILSILLSLPDEISGEELVGATAVLLDLLDRERNNNIGGEI
ncbi:hypothetical protein ACLIKE_06985 [Ferroplasma acidiphilum]|uniref:Uncharacterized protein n=1 Tax=Ferroplasma acidiphilum TaxID=74969 RepID=A0A7K4FMG7_9ARCH|nr:hypothetical protein [Ferroplasma acidiphilum]NOL60242.1 hypothetical protein [Ferroplasma acidiphilum]